MTCCLLIIAISYLLGSIPVGLLLTQWSGLGDIRTIGSGNIGATNVLRTGNKKIAVLTLLLDAFKGFMAVFITHQLAPELVQTAALFAVIGHIFPVWLHFKGGKGIATALGVLLALQWQLALLAVGCWLMVANTTRYSSLAALAATLLLIPATLLGENRDDTILVSLLAALIFWTHRDNIKRLLQKTEPKIGQS